MTVRTEWGAMTPERAAHGFGPFTDSLWSERNAREFVEAHPTSTVVRRTSPTRTGSPPDPSRPSRYDPHVVGRVEVVVGGKPSRGTKADKRLAANKPAAKKAAPFGGKKANPFKKKG